MKTILQRAEQERPLELVELENFPISNPKRSKQQN